MLLSTIVIDDPRRIVQDKARHADRFFSLQCRLRKIRYRIVWMTWFFLFFLNFIHLFFFIFKVRKPITAANCLQNRRKSSSNANVNVNMVTKWVSWHEWVSWHAKENTCLAVFRKWRPLLTRRQTCVSPCCMALVRMQGSLMTDTQWWTFQTDILSRKSLVWKL